MNSIPSQNQFLEHGSIAVHSNAAIYAKDKNVMLSKVLNEIGIDCITSSACSPELNPMELMFNAMVQYFASKHSKSNASNNEGITCL